MNFLWLAIVILLIIGVLALLLYTVAAKLLFVLDTDAMNVGLKLTWLNPLFKAFVKWEGTYWNVIIRLFGIKIYNKPLKGGKRHRGKHGGAYLVREVRPTAIHVSADYGFCDPYATGMACGAISMVSMISQMPGVESIRQQPDFSTRQDYIHLKAAAKLNVAHALFGVFKARRARVPV